MKKNTKFSTALLRFKSIGNKDDLVFKIDRSFPFEIVTDCTLSLTDITYHMKIVNKANNNLIGCHMSNRYTFYNANYQYSYVEKSAKSH